MSLTGRKIAALRDTFEKFRFEFEGQEAWRARDLMRLLGYTGQNVRQRFRNNVIARAWQSCAQSERDPTANFVVEDGSDAWRPDRIFTTSGEKSGRGRPAEDIIVTRFAAYLIAMNGDPNKPEVAFAQRYFATQTRKQEVLEQHLLDDDRIKAHGKFSKSEAELKEVVSEAGGNEQRLHSRAGQAGGGHPQGARAHRQAGRQAAQKQVMARLSGRRGAVSAPAPAAAPGRGGCR